MTDHNLSAFIMLAVIGFLCRTMPRFTPKWRDDRTMEQLGAFFYGAALVVLFV